MSSSCLAPVCASRSGDAVRVVRVDAWRPASGDARASLAVEEPLEIRLDGSPLAVTMRTPGDDEDLAAGFALTEGLIGGSDDLSGVCVVIDVPPDARGNVVDVRLREPAADMPARARRRAGLLTSACGVCGQGTIDAVRRRARPVAGSGVMEAACLVSMPDTLRSAQAVFSLTGGLHAAGLFSLDGRLIAAREDIGRHNAVDKVVGHAVRQRLLPLSGTALMVSGRAGFEIVLKAWMAGIPVVASVSAPSSLAVQLAEEADITLVGFLRGSDYTVYHGLHRVPGMARSRANPDACPA